MNLLVAQLQNQDPLSPMDPTAMTAQLTQLSSLQQLEGINSSISNLGSNHSPQSALSEASTALGKTAFVSLGTNGATSLTGSNQSLHYDFGGVSPAQASLVETDSNGTVIGTWPLQGSTGDISVGNVASGSTFNVTSRFANGQTDTANSGNSMLSQAVVVKSVSLSNGAAYIVNSQGQKAPWSSVIDLM